MVEVWNGVSTLCCLTAGFKYYRINGDALSYTLVGNCHFEAVLDFRTTCVWVGTGTMDTGPYPLGAWHWIVDHGLPSEAGGGTEIRQWMRPLSSLDAVLVVPLVDEGVTS